MNVYLNDISGIPDAITSMFITKRHWSRTLELKIRTTCETVLTKEGSLKQDDLTVDSDLLEQYQEWMGKLLPFGKKHITMLRYIDFSITVDGLHRAGQDDWDSHAKRFDNRIIRESTRSKQGFVQERSSFYENNIIPTDIALQLLEQEVPDTLEWEGRHYVKTINGYILEEKKNDPDVRRGLYMLSIPSVFLFKVNLCEFAHVYKERGIHGGAHPEVKELAERIADRLEEAQPLFTRDLLLQIQN